MTTNLPTDHETSIRVLAFKGEREKWRQWKIKTKAIGTQKKWFEALENDWAYDAWTTTLTADEVANKKLNDKAWNYLVMACEDEPFDIITSDTESNAWIAWNKLKEEYEPSTDETLVDVQETCRD
jgi:hypothetical protein